jgi:hypothetical protein
MPSRKPTSVKPRSAYATAAQAGEALASFIAKFEPGTAALIEACRTELKNILPTVIELVYDNYNFFVIGYCSSERASDCIVSIAAAANRVGPSFRYGAALPDSARILEGSGKQHRIIRLPAASMLREPAVFELIQAAATQRKTQLARTGEGHLVIKSVSAQQNPRQRQKSAPRSQHTQPTSN